VQDRTGLTVFLVRVVFVLFETRRFCKVERFVFPDLRMSFFIPPSYGGACNLLKSIGFVFSVMFSTCKYMT